jgi:aconitate hydratase
MGEGTDPFDAKDTIVTSGGPVELYRLDRLEQLGLGSISSLPYSIRVLLEGLLRNSGGPFVTEDDVRALARWGYDEVIGREIPFIPSRIVLQDFTGVPAVVDLAAMRSAVHRMGGDPARINPVVPADLVIDHSVQVDRYGTRDARQFNEAMEFSRNQERYAVLRWAQESFDGFRVIPPGRGIVHQVNLEYLASVVHFWAAGGKMKAFPDTLVGTDSHTTMINGIGVLGWGVGGIEAEAVMLGQPYYMPIPEVVGFKLMGELREGITATDLVLTITRILRNHGVVGKFVEFFGPGVEELSVPDRATISNMSPEYGATMGYFPVDEVTLGYLIDTGRPEEHVSMVRDYLKTQGLLFSKGAPEPMYTETLELDMATVVPTLAGPKRPQDSIHLSEMPNAFEKALVPALAEGPYITENHNRWDSEGGDLEGGSEPDDHAQPEGKPGYLENGAVVIAAITSCTNTSNPSVLVGAALLARNAVKRGLRPRSYVKTSMAPGSRVVTEYLKRAGLLPYLEQLGFHLVGYGCTTCIGNSGPLPEDVAREVEDRDLTVAAVLSGNRNFEGRINPHVKANYLASPPLVVAYALAGTVDIDLTWKPLGFDADGKPVMLADIWPTQEEIDDVIEENLDPGMFEDSYADVMRGTAQWDDLAIPEGKLYDWDGTSTYIREPPFFMKLSSDVGPIEDVIGARVLALLGDSITTDHISPAGAIPVDGPAGRNLVTNGVAPVDFNTYGSRRGNHEIMMRGTFANIRIRNQLVPGSEGGVTRHLPSGEEMSIFDAAMRYAGEDVPLIVIAGKEYGSGSSRDWAAKGTQLLGVRAVIAESYERIHRSNLVGMGVVPLRFKEAQNARTLGLTGKETYQLTGMDGLVPGGDLDVKATSDDGSAVDFRVTIMLNSQVELGYLRNGGILHKFIRDMMEG